MNLVQGRHVAVVIPPAPISGLPVSRVSRPSSSDQVKRPRDAPPVSTGDRVLVIDDDPALVRLLTELLKRQGFRVDVGIDGKNGLRLARTREYAVVVLDHKLPHIMGMDVLKTLRAERMTTPIIMLTGRGDENIAFEAGQLGAARYITKPFRPADLIEAIGSVLTTEQSQGSVAADDVDAGPARGSPVLQEFRSVPERPLYGRWVQAVLAVVTADRDTRIEEDWASCVGVSVATLRQWHRVGKLPVGRSQLLARVLRASVLALRFGGSLDDFLEASDRRTIERMVELAGAEDPSPSVRDILTRQRLVSNRFAVVELERALERAGLL